MASVGYVSGDPRKVSIAGDSMTGPLVLPGLPTLALQASTKSYVDNSVLGSGDVTFSRVVVIPHNASGPPSDTPNGTIVIQLQS